MDRNTFLKTCGLACLGGLGVVLPACGSIRRVRGDIVVDNLVLPLDQFESRKGGNTVFKDSLIVYHEILKYPVCVYRITDREYRALWMRCTHQGTELQVFGDRLQCPAHGSEFDSSGLVRNGPAAEKLRTFPVDIENNQLKISLKKI
jgi:Rieske Fe-S protein